ncbi:beta-glucosidase BglX [Mangrovimonas sp. YM274]|uniref:beta-glucosidase BglX n=1 Tax=Mangrovimonas sp. YM274 TaxID=3070660 RepID=UPI0027DB0B18|nr:beta-glucosidase BglX [Mangrovimonas sp. YM274]WMI69148.1 beta-glucosidase BglX [Mangrovimonas sp. YM274]
MKTRLNNVWGYALAVLLCACGNANDTKKSVDTNVKSQQGLNPDIERKVDSLLDLMTLEEKIGQMNQYTGFWEVTGPMPSEGNQALKYEHLKKGWVGSMLNVTGAKEVTALQKIAVEETRLGIPLIIGFDVVHGYKTVSPIPLAEAASWDLEAIQRSAEVAAKEAAASGINWTFAPMVDISRDVRWGRVMEGAGEDPFLGSKIAIARVQGFQGDDLSANSTIAACAKHFAAYGFPESGKDYNTADLGTSTLYNVVLPPFKAANDAGARTFMNSFNELNGIPATGDSFLQRQILKGDWNFNGFVVSDWGSIGEMIAHGYAKDGQEAAKIAANAGSDMDMESHLYVEHLSQLVKDGAVKEAYINDAARRILRVKYELGLFEDPYKYSNETNETNVVGSTEIKEAVLDMAKKSIVLLKNDKQLLPLKKDGLNIAVIGALANDKTSPLGNWRLGAKNGTAISLLEGLATYKGNTITYVQGPNFVENDIAFSRQLEYNSSNKKGVEEAVSAAKNADVVLMALGEHAMQTGEGRSQANIEMDPLQQELLEAVYKANPNIVLVLSNGRPLAINWANENIPSILETWHLGTQSGHAIAQVLYGDYNPSGKLPMTFPRSVGQVPIYYNHKSSGRPNEPSPGEVFWSHYTDESNMPLYPFGYGLSYTSFEYGNLQVSNVENNSVKVSVTITNTGAYSGKEVAQLYIHDLFASVTRPIKELKGFEMISLEPGTSQTVTFTLTEKELGFYDNQGKYIVEPGDFKVFVGGSSASGLESEFTIN